MRNVYLTSVVILSAVMMAVSPTYAGPPAGEKSAAQATPLTPVSPMAGSVLCRIGDREFEAAAAKIESVGAGPAARFRLKAEAGDAAGVIGVDLRAQTPAAPGEAPLLKAAPDASMAMIAGAPRPIADGVLTLEALTPATANAPGRAKGTAVFRVGDDEGRCAFDGPVAPAAAPPPAKR